MSPRDFVVFIFVWSEQASDVMLPIVKPSPTDSGSGPIKSIQSGRLNTASRYRLCRELQLVKFRSRRYS